MGDSVGPEFVFSHILAFQSCRRESLRSVLEAVTRCLALFHSACAYVSAHFSSRVLWVSLLCLWISTSEHLHLVS